MSSQTVCYCDHTRVRYLHCICLLVLLTFADYDQDDAWASGLYKKHITLNWSSTKMATIVFVLGICVILMGWSGAAPNDRE